MLKKWRILLILGTVLALPAALSGQDLAVGFKVAAGYPGFIGAGFRDTLDTYNGQRRFTVTTSVGAYLVIGLFDFLALQPEVLYTMTGAAFEVDAGAAPPAATGRVDQSVRLNYLEVPLLLKLRLGRFSLYAGPDLFLRMNHGSYSQKAGDPAAAAALEAAGLDAGAFEDAQLRTLLLAGAAGLEVDLALGNAILTLGGRYVLSFQSPNDPAAVAPVFRSNEFKLNHILLTVGVGYGSGR